MTLTAVKNNTTISYYDHYPCNEICITQITFFGVSLIVSVHTAYIWSSRPMSNSTLTFLSSLSFYVLLLVVSLGFIYIALVVSYPQKQGDNSPETYDSRLPAHYVILFSLVGIALTNMCLIVDSNCNMAEPCKREPKLARWLNVLVTLVSAAATICNSDPVIEGIGHMPGEIAAGAALVFLCWLIAFVGNVVLTTQFCRKYLFRPREESEEFLAIWQLAPGVIASTFAGILVFPTYHSLLVYQGYVVKTLRRGNHHFVWDSEVSRFSFFSYPLVNYLVYVILCPIFRRAFDCRRPASRTATSSTVDNLVFDEPMETREGGEIIHRPSILHRENPLPSRFQERHVLIVPTPEHPASLDISQDSDVVEESDVKQDPRHVKRNRNNSDDAILARQRRRKEEERQTGGMNSN